MNDAAIPDAFRAEFRRFPEPLRALVASELGRGNAIVEVGGGFPAPPCGSCLKLERPMTAPAGPLAEGIRACSYPNWTYSTGYCDGAGHFFVMDPPKPPEPEPDWRAMQEPRAEAPAPVPRRTVVPKAPADEVAVPAAAVASSVPEVPRTPLDRFKASLKIDYEKWHDGIGYDLDAIREGSPEERRQMEELILESGGRDWRDIEALAVLDTPRARERLRRAAASGGPEVQMSVLSHAPGVVTEAQKLAWVLRGIREADLYGGLTATLRAVEAFHPPEVIDALFEAVLERKGDVAVNLAGMLLYVHGKAEETFDMSQRPFLLRFAAESREERLPAFRELCERVGADGARYLEAGRRRHGRSRKKE